MGARSGLRSRRTFARGHPGLALAPPMLVVGADAPEPLLIVGAFDMVAVSYTHLTLPTIYSV